MNQSEPSFLNEEISISQLLNVFIENKKIIFIFVFSFVFLGVIYSLSLKNVYSSVGQVYLQPTYDSNQSGGGILDLISGSTPSDDKVKIAYAMLISNEFIDDFLGLEENAKYILTANGYNKRKKELTYDRGLLKLAEKDKFFALSQRDRAEIYLSYLTFEYDDDSPLIEIGFKSMSPEISQYLSTALIQHINNYSRDDEIKRSQKKLTTLRDNLVNDSSLEIRAFIGNVIENELKTIMLAESDDFLFRVVQKPHFPEVKDSPLRTLICLYFAAAGFFASLLFILISRFRQKK